MFGILLVCVFFLIPIFAYPQIGGAGLIAGVAKAVKTLKPDVQIIGVHTALYDMALCGIATWYVCVNVVRMCVLEPYGGDVAHTAWHGCVVYKKERASKRVMHGLQKEILPILAGGT